MKTQEQMRAEATACTEAATLERNQHTVKKVSLSKKYPGTFDLDTELWSFWVYKNPFNLEPPCVSTQVIRYEFRGTTAGVSFIVENESLEEVETFYFFDTPEEIRARWEAEQALAQIKKEETYAANLPLYRQQIAALPLVFQERFDLFEKFCGLRWMVANLAYELFVAEEAVKMAAYFSQPNTASPEEFHAFGFEEQIKLVPTLSRDHSGNTFGAAIYQANTFLKEPHLIPYVHAAIHNLTGCTEAGCFAVRKEYTGETLPTKISENK